MIIGGIIPRSGFGKLEDVTEQGPINKRDRKTSPKRKRGSEIERLPLLPRLRFVLVNYRIPSTEDS